MSRLAFAIILVFLLTEKCLSSESQDSLEKAKKAFAQKDYALCEKEYLTAAESMRKTAPVSLELAKLLNNIGVTMLYLHKKKEASDNFAASSDMMYTCLKNDPRLRTSGHLVEMLQISERAASAAEQSGDTSKANAIRGKFAKLNMSLAATKTAKASQADPLSEERNELAKERVALQRERESLQRASTLGHQAEGTEPTTPNFSESNIAKILAATPEEISRAREVKTQSVDYVHGTSTVGKGRLPGRLTTACDQFSKTYGVSKQGLIDALENGQILIELQNGSLFLSNDTSPGSEWYDGAAICISADKRHIFLRGKPSSNISVQPLAPN